MTLKNIFTLALFSLLLNSSAVFAADNSAVLGKWTLDMSVQGQQVLVNLTIAEDGDGLGGTKRVQLLLIHCLKLTLTETFAIIFMQTQQGSLNVTFDLEDNMLNGSLSTPMGNLPKLAGNPLKFLFRKAY